MNTNRVVLILAGLTVILQISVLYRQNATPPRATRPTVVDAPPGTTLDLNSMPVRGNVAARVVFVEFSDYECPYCARYANGVAKQLQKRFMDSGKVKFAFANNPLPIHKNADLLATAAICAGDQGRYWEMHDRLFLGQPKGKEELAPLVSELSMNSHAFQECLEHNEMARKRVDKDRESAKAFQLTATPAFAIGTEVGGVMTVKKFVYGAQPEDLFTKTISTVISGSPQQTAVRVLNGTK